MNKKKPLHRLVYWYGAAVDKAFSFIPSNKIVSYENGVKRGLHVLPLIIQKKMDTKRKLNGTEENLMKGLLEMADDVELPPKDRSLWLQNKAQDDDEESSGEESSDREVGSSFVNISDHSDDEETGRVVSSKQLHCDSDSDLVSPAKYSSLGRVSKKFPDVIACDDSFINNATSLKPESIDDDNGKQPRKRRKIMNDEVEESSVESKKIIQEDCGFDFRISLHPKASTNTHREKSYTLLVCREDEVLMEEEIRMDDINDGSVKKQVQYNNIELNLTFNLQM